MSWVVYVLVSKSSGQTYVGITTDLERRVDQHNGRLPGGARTTARGRPWSVARIVGHFETRGEAQSIEARTKKLRGLDRLRCPVD